MKRLVLIVLLVLCASQVSAAGIIGLVADYVDAVDQRIAAQAQNLADPAAAARYLRCSADEQSLAAQLRQICHGGDDIAEVTMGYVTEADMGDRVLYFQTLIPTDGDSPAAHRLLAKINKIARERRVAPRVAAEFAAAAQALRRTDTEAEPAATTTDDTDIPPDLAKFTKIADQKPTYYVTQREAGFPTSGTLYGQNYDGTEVKSIMTPSGEVIAKTSGRYFAALCMQGSGVINDGRTVSFISNQRFQVAPQGCLGITATGYWVVPFHTLAVNRNQIPYRGVYFVPGTRGLKLPNGEIHDGYWFAHDTGSAFNNTTNRLDMYADRDEYWKWMEANFVPSFTPVKFYRVDDATKAKVYAKYQSQLGR